MEWFWTTVKQVSSLESSEKYLYFHILAHKKVGLRIIESVRNSMHLIVLCGSGIIFRLGLFDHSTQAA